MIRDENNSVFLWSSSHASTPVGQLRNVMKEGKRGEDMAGVP